tara:strand:- start:555 stop:869 length:315 start_codon:yes stop_codon:yes gene_type:complete
MEEEDLREEEFTNMKAIETKYGTIFHEDGKYILEKIYRDLGDLIEEEPKIKKRAKKLGFTIEDSIWYIEDNPLYEAEKILQSFAEIEPSEIRFRYKVILLSCTY